MKSYLRGKSVQMRMQVRVGGALCDADQALCTVYCDATGVAVVDNIACTKTAQGKYAYNFSIPTDAVLSEYTMIGTAIMGSRIVGKEQKFMVVWK